MNHAPLGEVVHINPRGDRLAADEAVSFVGMAQLDAVTAVATPLGSRAYGEVSKGYTQFRDNDVLAAKITPCWENGKVGIARLEHSHGAGSTEFHVFRSTPAVDSRYLLHFLRQPHLRPSGRLRMTGSGGQRRVPESFFASLSIPVPPVNEQRRIAAILDQADAVRAKRREALAHLDALPQSIFGSMFLPATWPLVPLEELCIIAGEYGAGVPSIESSPELPRYVRITDITELGELTPYARGPGGERGDWSRYELLDGDLLFARSGATVGKTYRHRAANGECIFAGYLIRFRPDRSRLDPDYLFAFTKTSTYKSWVAARQNVVAQPNINAKQYGRELLIPVPPFEMQTRYGREVLRIAEHRQRIWDALALDEQLFASLQHRAFRGEL